VPNISAHFRRQIFYPTQGISNVSVRKSLHICSTPQQSEKDSKSKFRARSFNNLSPISQQLLLQPLSSSSYLKQYRYSPLQPLLQPVWHPISIEPVPLFFHIYLYYSNTPFLSIITEKQELCS